MFKAQNKDEWTLELENAKAYIFFMNDQYYIGSKDTHPETKCVEAGHPPDLYGKRDLVGIVGLPDAQFFVCVLQQ